MFLHPQHFQQQDRYVEGLIEARTQPVSPYPWGLLKFATDGNALRQGRFALSSASGIFKDGTPFDFPDWDSPPPSLDIGRDCRDEIVYLALAEKRDGIRESGAETSESANTRLRSERVSSASNSGDELRKEEIEVGNLRLKYLLHRDNRTGYTCLPIARIVERDKTGTVQLAPDFIAPCLSAKDHPVLQGYLQEVLGLIKQRADLIGERASRPGYGAGAELVQYLWLVSLNRAQPLFANLLEQPAVHPAQAYAALASLAGELSSYSRASRRAALYPPYSHEAGQDCFNEVMEDLRRSFRTVIEELAVAIPLEKDDSGVLVGRIPDVALTRTARFVLTVQASARADMLRQHFPGNVKVAPLDLVMQFVQTRSNAIVLRAMETAPTQISYYDKAVYFELLRDPDPHKLWTRLESVGSLGIYVMGQVPNLALELWAIRARS